MLRTALFLLAIPLLHQSAISQHMDFETLDGPYGGYCQHLIQLDTSVLLATISDISFSGNRTHWITYDAGSHWQPSVGLPVLPHPLSAARSSNNRLFIGTEDALYVSDDSGRSWKESPLSCPGVDFILPLQNNDLLLRSAPGYTYDSLYILSSSLHTLTNITPNYDSTLSNRRWITDVEQLESGTLLAAIVTDLVRSTDLGRSWDTLTTWVPSSDLTRISSIESAGQKIFVLSYTPFPSTTQFDYSLDGGNTWTTSPTASIDGNELSIIKGHAYVVDYEGIYISDTAYVHWTHYKLSDIDILSLDGTIYEYDGVFQKSTDLGMTWTSAIGDIQSHPLVSVWARGDTIIAMNKTGTGWNGHPPPHSSTGGPQYYFLSTNGGVSWDEPSPVTSAFREMEKDRWSKDGTFVVAESLMYIRHQYGYYVVDLTSGSFRFFVFHKYIEYADGTRKNAMIYHPESGYVLMETEDRIFSTFGVDSVFTEIDYPVPGNRYKLLHSSDERIFISGAAGEPWETGYTIYQYDPILNQCTELCQVDQSFGNSYHRAITSRNEIVTSRGRWIDISRDLGNSWLSWGIPLKDSQRISVIRIDENDIIYVGVSEPYKWNAQGGLYYSTDGGYSWNDAGLDASIANIDNAANGDLFAVTSHGEVFRTTPNLQYVVSTDGIPAAPGGIALSQNYPNPVMGSTTISFSLGDASDVTLEVYNTLGRKVATVLQSRAESGAHSIPFDASGLTPGMYRYVLRSSEGMHSKWMTVVK